jgi:hypothetical protein
MEGVSIQNAGDCLLALVQDFHNLVRRELLAATRGDDGAGGNGADGGIVEGDPFFIENPYQSVRERVKNGINLKYF